MRDAHVSGVALHATLHPLLSSPTLYERTGDVKDANTMLVNRGELRAALGVTVSIPHTFAPPDADTDDSMEGGKNG